MSGSPVQAFDVYEHAYAIDYGAGAKDYIDAFFKNIGVGRGRAAPRARAKGRRGAA